jgi:Uncharacterized protein conserved in bacteria
MSGPQAHFFVGGRFYWWSMSTRRNVEVIQRVTEIVEGVGKAQGIEVVDVELLGAGKNRVLRIYIDKQDGITLADCEFVSHGVSDVLDTEDVVPGSSYTLEVSSPGVDRKLSKPQDFQRFLGKKARIVLREPVENQRRWEGRLAGFSDGVITLEPTPGKSIQFAIEQIEKANLKFEW